MPQWKTLTLGILFTIAALCLLLDNANPCLYPFAVAAVLFLGLWFYQYRRDRHIIASAQQEREVATHTPVVLPPMTSTATNRLFIPQPLDSKKGD